MKLQRNGIDFILKEFLFRSDWTLVAGGAARLDEGGLLLCQTSLHVGLPGARCLLDNRNRIRYLNPSVSCRRWVAV